MSMVIALAALLVGLILASCSAHKLGTSLADMPSEWGGLPKDAPPRPGTPEYETWQRQRALDAATPKISNR